MSGYAAGDIVTYMAAGQQYRGQIERILRSVEEIDDNIVPASPWDPLLLVKDLTLNVSTVRRPSQCKLDPLSAAATTSSSSSAATPSNNDVATPLAATSSSVTIGDTVALHERTTSTASITVTSNPTPSPAPTTTTTSNVATSTSASSNHVRDVSPTPVIASSSSSSTTTGGGGRRSRSSLTAIETPSNGFSLQLTDRTTGEPALPSPDGRLVVPPTHAHNNGADGFGSTHARSSSSAVATPQSSSLLPVIANGHSHGVASPRRAVVATVVAPIAAPTATPRNVPTTPAGGLSTTSLTSPLLSPRSSEQQSQRSVLSFYDNLHVNNAHLVNVSTSSHPLPPNQPLPNGNGNDNDNGNGVAAATPTNRAYAVVPLSSSSDAERKMTNDASTSISIAAAARADDERRAAARRDADERELARATDEANQYQYLGIPSTMYSSLPSHAHANDGILHSIRRDDRYGDVIELPYPPLIRTSPPSVDHLNDAQRLRRQRMVQPPKRPSLGLADCAERRRVLKGDE
jgi:hypothetical protein